MEKEDRDSCDSFDADPTPGPSNLMLRISRTQPAVASAINDCIKKEPADEVGNTSIDCLSTIALGDSQHTHSLDEPPAKRQRPIALPNTSFKTFIFFDLETTGLFKNDDLAEEIKRKMFLQPRTSEEITDRMEAVLRRTRLTDAPYITEMSFVVVRRNLFEEGARRMNNSDSNTIHLGQQQPLRARVAVDSHTFMVRPPLTAAQWVEYEKTRIRTDAIHNRRVDLESQSPFPAQWMQVVSLLKSCEKPACLVAHNGMTFDFRVLFAELKRNNLESTFPDQIHILDSLLAFRVIEDEHREEIHKVVNTIDWNSITEQVNQSRIQSHAGASVVEAARLPHEMRDLFDDTQSQTPNGMTLTRPSPQQQLTPTRPPPLRSTMSEPAKIHNRRALFTRLAPEVPIREDHPLLYMRTEKWSPAKKKRASHGRFVCSAAGGWTFDKVADEREARSKGNYTLKQMYSKYVGGSYDAHYSLEDCFALLQVSMTFGDDFIQFADRFGFAQLPVWLNCF